MGVPLATFLHFDEPWYIYAVMPIIASLVGYLTKLVAIEMIFKPLEFKGIKPWFGWQGMVPRRAAKMAGIAVDTLTRDLLDPKELFARLDADELIAEIEGPLHDTIAELTEEIAAEFHPNVWEIMPGPARRALISRVEKAAPAVTRRLMEEIRENVDQVFDIKHMVVTNLVRDKATLNRMFREVAAEEMKFMAKAGGIFGAYIGAVQVVAFILTGSHLILPIFGLITGGLTDWIALHMIFRPKEKGRLFGILPWHGMFHKRREEITKRYSSLMAKDVLTPSAVIESLLDGPMSDRLFQLIDKEIQVAVDQQSGIVKPFVAMAVGGRRYQETKQAVAERVISRLPEHAALVEGYAADKLDLANLLAERMGLMETDQYEELLRPAFREDEKTVIFVGALLGFIVGEVQAALLL